LNGGHSYPALRNDGLRQPEKSTRSSRSVF